MIALPAYIDQEAWMGFEEMRRQIKKPMTDRARKLVLYELQRIKDACHDSNAALDQSTNHCWADVYEPKQKPITVAKPQEIERANRQLAEQIAEQRKNMASVETVQALRDRVKANLRRVA